MQIPDRPPSRDHINPRSKGHALDGNRALVCCRCNADKDSLSLGQWLTRLVRAGDARDSHVLAFMSQRGFSLDFPAALVMQLSSSPWAGAGQSGCGLHP